MLRTAAGRSGMLPLARCFSSIPIVDVSALVQPHADPEDPKVRRAADELYRAAHDVGFFYAVEHGTVAKPSAVGTYFLVLQRMMLLVCWIEVSPHPQCRCASNAVPGCAAPCQPVVQLAGEARISDDAVRLSNLLIL